MSAGRDKFLAALAQFAPRPLAIPELGEGVYVRPITVGGMARIHAAQARDPQRVPVLMLLDSLVDESGALIFGPDDYDAVAAIPGRIAEKILAAIDEVSELRAKSAEDAAGN